MIIELDKIGIAPKMIELRFDSAEIDLEDDFATLNGPVDLTGEMVRTGGKAHLRGTIDSQVSIACARRLDPVVRPLHVTFDSVFVDSADETSRDETELADDDLNESLVEDGTIEAAEVVREQILLSLPERVFCNDNCKGLCPKCGAKLNLIDCKCTDNEVDPRWAALRNLK